jgi:hypothetical protein
MRRLISTVELPKESNASSALSVAKPLQRPLIPSTTVAKSARARFTLFCNPTVREPVYEGSVASLDGLTTPWSVWCAKPLIRHSKSTTEKCSRWKWMN